MRRIVVIHWGLFQDQSRILPDSSIAQVTQESCHPHSQGHGRKTTDSLITVFKSSADNSTLSITTSLDLPKHISVLKIPRIFEAEPVSNSATSDESEGLEQLGHKLLDMVGA